MWRVMLGTVFGIYLAQNYKLPNIKTKFLEIEKYLRETSAQIRHNRPDNNV